MDDSDTSPAHDTTEAKIEDPVLPSAVGSQMVSKALSTSPRRLYQLHTTGSTADILAQLVVMAAHRLDHLHAQLADAAQTAASTLTCVASGKTTINSLGVLRTAPPKSTSSPHAVPTRSTASRRSSTPTGRWRRSTTPPHTRHTALAPPRSARP